ncbi:MAG TPA: peptide chain release factor N(5)-glutamine methyltransferase [Gemmatimonadaceae bacterium]
MPTLHELTTVAASRLKDAGIAPDEADLDAQLLAAEALGWDRTRFITSWRDPAPAPFLPAFGQLIARRERREPISQILGVREFWGLPFEVTRDVLTPRPETEGVIEAAIEHVSRAQARGLIRSPAIIQDVGTGSGCIAVALAKELPEVQLIAVDVSAAALAVARRNARRHGVADRIAFLHRDLSAEEDDVDAIVSNPPYIPTPDRDSLPPEVRDYEPPEALFAGEDGLQVIRLLVASASTDLAEGGLLIFECGVDQAPAIREMIANTTALELVEIRPDLAGIPRTVVARRIR